MIKTVVFDVSWQRSLKSVHRFKILKTGHTKTLCCGFALSHHRAKQSQPPLTASTVNQELLLQ